jgi:hypothetical protein
MRKKNSNSNEKYISCGVKFHAYQSSLLNGWQNLLNPTQNRPPLKPQVLIAPLAKAR